METWIVTGGAGFIGSNFVRMALAETAARVVVLDKLTYAGHLESLADLQGDPRFHFVQGDIADRRTVEALFRDHEPEALLIPQHNHDWVVSGSRCLLKKC